MKFLKTEIVLMVLLCLSINSFCQIDLEIQTQSGYEYNYFRSPNQVIFEGDLLEEDDLIFSSIYQKTNLDLEYETEWKSNRLRFQAKPNITIFYDNIDDSFWDASFTTKYEHYLTRRTTFLAEAHVKRMNRSGLDGAQDVIVNPLGYTNLGAKLGLEFEPIEANKTKIQTFFNYRNFDAYGDRDLEFKEAGVSIRSKQELQVGSNEQEIGLYTYFKIRKYDTFNATNVITNGVRDWSYFKIKPYYRFPLGENLELKPSFTLYKRIDKRDVSGFTQFGPELNLKYKNAKLEVNLNASYLTRNYKSIEARDNDGLIGENLKYRYNEINLKAAYKLNKHFWLTLNGFSRLRHTNYTDLEARSFRNYRNQYFGLGVKWEL